MANYSFKYQDEVGRTATFTTLQDAVEFFWLGHWPGNAWPKPSFATVFDAYLDVLFEIALDGESMAVISADGQICKRVANPREKS